MRVKRAVGCLVCAAFVQSAIALSAQDSPASISERQVPPSASERPVAIPASGILKGAEETLAELRRIEAKLAPSSELETAQSRFDGQRDAVVKLRAELDGLNASRVSTRVLQDHRLKWVKLQARLEGYMSLLEERFRILQDERDHLARTRNQWETTREVATAEEFSEELVQRIDTVLQRLSGVEARLSERRDALAVFIDPVSRGQEVAADALERVDAMASVVRERWLSRDEPPIWDASPLADRSSLWREVQEAERYWVATASEFVAERKGSVSFLAVLWVGFLAAGQLLGRRGRFEQGDEEPLDPARFVVSRRASAALAFTLAAAIPVLGGAPGPIRDAIALLSIIPVVRLGTGLLPAPARPALYGTVGLFLLNRLWEMAPDGSLVSRLMLVLVTLLASCGGIVVVRHWRASGMTRRGAWWRAASAGLVLSTALLAASFLFGVLGWTTLSRLLTAATIESAYRAVAWAVFAAAVAALIRLVPGSAIGRLLPSVSRHERQFNRIGVSVVVALILLRWGSSTLRNFQVYEPVRQSLEAGLSVPLARGTLDVRLGDILAATLIVVVTLVVSRFIQFALREEILPRLNLAPGVAHSIVTLVNYSVVAFGIILASSTLGLSGTQLTVVFGALGVGIGFGLQTIVANFISGLVLIFERPIKVGDRVQTREHFGIVTDIGIRASTIRTFDGADVLVPNGDLVSKEVINWTRSDSFRRVEVALRVALGADARKVLGILTEVAGSHPLVLEKPEPSAWMIGFGADCLEFRLFAWTLVENFLAVSSELHVAVHDALGAVGIEIPVPQRDLHVREIREAYPGFESGEVAASSKPPFSS